ncbi:Dephospho-CoA kinase [Rubripirellula obstinata]|uniref:Dephospho-CoA kinase n=1 Tax=Rubripirellula obstinata TaxID=406547 RepID=A0A5B1CHF5_9BACT|nr:dephospho-CoA kinase [Rubripirellula obstinata]KAA1259000.1 Dephospho-CoA kinase [Rubripirellula obstinata]
MIVLGIVGSIAGGKSTVARYLQESGAAWIDADSLAKQSLDLADVKEKLVLRFGNQVLNAGGGIDRAEIGSIVFGNDQASQAELRYLESIVHPIVRNQVLQKLKSNASSGVQVSLLDVPLLFESGWDRCCDEVWCIDADPEIRAARAANRGWHPDEIVKREQRQLPIATKIQLSNRVIQNNGSMEELHQRVDQHWQSLLTKNVETDSDTHCR